MEAILSRFSLQGRPLTCERYGQGHINLTYLVTTDSGRRYILQRLSRAAFHDIPALMRNVAAVTGFLAARSTDPRQTLHLIPTRDGETWVRDEAGEAWRVYDYVEDSICLQVPESPEDLYESAIAFGNFQRMLADFPAETLHETIPNFHNTPDRYRIFRETLAADPMGRAAGIQREIDFVLAREEEAGALQRMRESGELPLGAKVMTLECGLRFLTDHLDGDHYFGISRRSHNLDRARTQFKLVADTERRWSEICGIIKDCRP